MRLVVVPWLPGKRVAVTLAPYVLILPLWAYDHAILAHEWTHLDQIERYGGRLRWYWRYITDIDFRRAQEAEGYAKQREVERNGIRHVL